MKPKQNAQLLMLDASVVFLIVISALATVIWIRGNVGDKLGKITIDQNKEKSDLGRMEREVSNITQHVGGTFRKGRKVAGKGEKDKDKNVGKNRGEKKRDSNSKNSVNSEQGNNRNGRKKGV